MLKWYNNPPWRTEPLAESVSTAGVHCTQVAVSNFRDSVDSETTGPTCGIDFSGIEDDSGEICCSPACSKCGGSGCAAAGGASNCCTGTIESAGLYCDDTAEAPCIIGGMYIIFDHYMNEAPTKRWKGQYCSGCA